ncbi:MAG: hypothetical protein BRC26_02300, partial [Nanohaloarchaea archaeon QH_8_44_6]
RVNKTMIAAVRVRGDVDVRQKISHTLDNLKLRQKHQVVLLEDSDSNRGMLALAKDYIAYGEISDETVEELANKKGEEVENGDVLSLTPPSGGFKDTRQQVGQGGSLGERNNMDGLVNKMV